MKHEYPVTDGFVEYHRGAGYKERADRLGSNE